MKVYVVYGAESGSTWGGSDWLVGHFASRKGAEACQNAKRKAESDTLVKYYIREYDLRP